MNAKTSNSFLTLTKLRAHDRVRTASWPRFSKLRVWGLRFRVLRFGFGVRVFVDAISPLGSVIILFPNRGYTVVWGIMGSGKNKYSWFWLLGCEPTHPLIISKPNLAPWFLREGEN